MAYLVGHSVDGQGGGGPSRHDAVHPQRLRLQAVGGGRLQGEVRSGTTEVGGASLPRGDVSEKSLLPAASRKRAK